MHSNSTLFQSRTDNNGHHNVWSLNKTNYTDDPNQMKSIVLEETKKLARFFVDASSGRMDIATTFCHLLTTIDGVFRAVISIDIFFSKVHRVH